MAGYGRAGRASESASNRNVSLDAAHNGQRGPPAMSTRLAVLPCGRASGSLSQRRALLRLTGSAMQVRSMKIQKMSVAPGQACQMGRAGSESGEGSRHRRGSLSLASRCPPPSRDYCAVFGPRHPCGLYRTSLLALLALPSRGPFDRPPRVTPDKVAAKKSSSRKHQQNQVCSRRQRAFVLRAACLRWASRENEEMVVGLWAVSSICVCIGWASRRSLQYL